MIELKPIENLFAVEVPRDAQNIAIKNGAYVKWITIDGNPFMPLNDPGKFRALFTTSSATEQQAAGVVEQQRGGGKFKDYECVGSYAQNGVYLIYTAIVSLQSLLRSNGLDLSKNYLLIKKTT